MTGFLIEVLGTPAPKGSSRAMMRGGFAVNVPSGSNASRDKLKSWDVAVRQAASAIVGGVTAPPLVDVPLEVRILFRMARPAGHWGKGKNAGRLAPGAPEYPRTKPDADKLARSTLDSLSGIVFDDDSRIVVLHVEKRYAAPGDEGATIRVEPMSAQRAITEAA